MEINSKESRSLDKEILDEHIKKLMFLYKYGNLSYEEEMKIYLPIIAMSHLYVLSDIEFEDEFYEFIEKVRDNEIRKK